MIEKTITPQIAAELLAKQHRNRTISEPSVRKYVGEMHSDRWIADELSPIVVDEEGRLLDGQHRMRAVVRYGKPVSFMVAVGTLESVDRHSEQRFRSHADRLKIVDGITSGTIVVALVRAIKFRLEVGPISARALPNIGMTTAAIRDWISYLKEEYNICIKQIVQDANLLYNAQPKRLRLMPPTTMAYLLFDASSDDVLYQRMQNHIRAIVADDVDRNASQRVARTRLMGTGEQLRNISMYVAARAFNERSITKIQLPRDAEPIVPDINGGMVECIND
jgi:hypothetical protein